MDKKSILATYAGKVLAIDTRDSNSKFYTDAFLDAKSLGDLIEGLDEYWIILTMDGLDFIKEYFGYLSFLEVVGVYLRLGTSDFTQVSGLKWLLRKVKSNSGIEKKAAESFRVDEDTKNMALKKYDTKALGNLLNPGVGLQNEFKAKDLLNPSTCMFFIDRLDSAELRLTQDGLDFLKRIYGWDKLIQMINLMKESGMTLRYDAPEDIVLWLNNFGRFPEDRLQMLLRDGY